MEDLIFSKQIWVTLRHGLRSDTYLICVTVICVNLLLFFSHYTRHCPHQPVAACQAVANMKIKWTDTLSDNLQSKEGMYSYFVHPTTLMINYPAKQTYKEIKQAVTLPHLLKLVRESNFISSHIILILEMGCFWFLSYEFKLLLMGSIFWFIIRRLLLYYNY